MIKRIPACLLLCCLFYACTSNPERLGNVYQSTDHEFAFNDNPDRELKIHYTGCGGMFISHSNNLLITDPYFSNQSFTSVLRKALFGGYIASDTSDINLGLSRARPDFNDSTRVLVTHAHYDHLMDVPWLFANRLDSSKTHIYGSTTTSFILDKYGIDSSLVSEVEANMATHDKPGKWIRLTETTRVLPVESHHAPHFAGIKLFCGKNTSGFKRCKNDPGRSKLNHWKEGQTFSWLVELTDGDKTFNLFINTSSSKEPFGLPPPEVLREHPIDLAVFCIANFNNARHYPEYHIGSVQPKAIMFIHWEDFFRGYQDPVRTVRGTRVIKFTSKVKRYYKKPFWLPAPGVTTTIRY